MHRAQCAPPCGVRGPAGACGAREIFARDTGSQLDHDGGVQEAHTHKKKNDIKHKFG